MLERPRMARRKIKQMEAHTTALKYTKITNDADRSVCLCIGAKNLSHNLRNMEHLKT